MTKPRVVLLYNQYKAGVNLTDRHTGEYTCQRKTRRWTLALMQNCIDLCVHNSYILFITANPEWLKNCPYRRRKYHEWLAKNLAIENVRERLQTFGHDKELRANIETFVENFETLYSETSRPTLKCFICRTQCRLERCAKCHSTACATHIIGRLVYRCSEHVKENISEIVKQVGKKRCNFCHRSKDRKTNVFCCICTKYVCNLHNRIEEKMKFCTKCLQL